MKDFLVVIAIFLVIIFSGKALRNFQLYHVPEISTLEQELKDWQPFLNK
tara:strand:+ start:548 stop:694 length:147 start_codon:yes stop_codon:yes gene_type:complete